MGAGQAAAGETTNAGCPNRLRSIAWASFSPEAGPSVSHRLLRSSAQRELAVNEARLFVTTRAFLDFASLRDLADLPPLQDSDTEHAVQDWAAVS